MYFSTYIYFVLCKKSLTVRWLLKILDFNETCNGFMNSAEFSGFTILEKMPAGRGSMAPRIS